MGLRNVNGRTLGNAKRRRQKFRLLLKRKEGHWILMKEGTRKHRRMLPQNVTVEVKFENVLREKTKKKFSKKFKK